MNKKHRSTLKAVFKIPVQSGIPWKEVETLLKSLGSEISEGSGFHRPHPRKEIDKEALCDMCRFLITAGVKP